MKIALYATLAAALLMLSPQTASAQERAGHPCKADREKFCQGLKPGDGKFGACMKEHEAELSPECAAARQERQDSWKNVRANCKADADKLCADAPKGRGMVKCLDSHGSELAQPCADALKSIPGGKNS